MHHDPYTSTVAVVGTFRVAHRVATLALEHHVFRPDAHAAVSFIAEVADSLEASGERHPDPCVNEIALVRTTLPFSDGDTPADHATETLRHVFWAVIFGANWRVKDNTLSLDAAAAEHTGYAIVELAKIPGIDLAAELGPLLDVAPADWPLFMTLLGDGCTIRRAQLGTVLLPAVA